MSKIISERTESQKPHLSRGARDGPPESSRQPQRLTHPPRKTSNPPQGAATRPRKSGSTQRLRHPPGCDHRANVAHGSPRPRLFAHKNAPISIVVGLRHLLEWPTARRRSQKTTARLGVAQRKGEGSRETKPNLVLQDWLLPKRHEQRRIGSTRKPVRPVSASGRRLSSPI